MTWARDVAERLHAAIGMRDTNGRRFDSDADTAEDYIKAVINRCAEEADEGLAVAGVDPWRRKSVVDRIRALAAETEA